MKLNKKALGALASFYARRNLPTFGGNEKEVMRDLFVSILIDDEYNYLEISRLLTHCELFFRVNTTLETYTQQLCDKSVAKLLRTIARNGKFPKIRSLRYC